MAERLEARRPDRQPLSVDTSALSGRNRAVSSLSAACPSTWCPKGHSFDRMELTAFVACGVAGGAMDHALACLLGLLGPRVSEACSIDIENLSVATGR